VIGWGHSITGGPPGHELFKFIYRTDSDGSVVVTAGNCEYLVNYKEELGSGMYSKVYKAINSNDSTKELACKEINSLRREFNEKERECVKHEIDLLRQIKHVSPGLDPIAAPAQFPCSTSV